MKIGLCAREGDRYCQCHYLWVREGGGGKSGECGRVRAPHWARHGTHARARWLGIEHVLWRALVTVQGMAPTALGSHILGTGSCLRVPRTRLCTDRYSGALPTVHLARAKLLALAQGSPATERESAIDLGARATGRVPLVWTPPCHSRPSTHSHLFSLPLTTPLSLSSLLCFTIL